MLQECNLPSHIVSYAYWDIVPVRGKLLRTCCRIDLLQAS